MILQWVFSLLGSSSSVHDKSDRTTLYYRQYDLQVERFAHARRPTKLDVGWKCILFLAGLL